jgi:hypothetical protein
MTKVIQSVINVCDRLAPRHIASAQQREIAVLAYRYWLARGFRNGSPQEDWLRAIRAVCRQRLSAGMGRSAGLAGHARNKPSRAA